MKTNDSLVAGGNIALLIQKRDENKNLDNGIEEEE